MSFATSFNVLTIGGSRNVGYYASLRLLAAGATITFLLRNPAAFLIKGDALIKSDVEHAWEEAKNNGAKDLDLLLFTGNTYVHFSKRSRYNSSNLVTQSLLNVLCTMPRTTPQPRIIVISAIGTTHASRQTPFALKPVYNFMLSEPLKDKLGVERALAMLPGGLGGMKSQTKTSLVVPTGKILKDFPDEEK
ncbi:hypothetical protein BDQ17DRAFT_1419152 [Cyathus striatus]|nr:hypothetical protein BDQ17DRAFT_1419152 [Cyathus striatus]